MANISADKESIAAFCGKHGIRRLALFGSVLLSDFRPTSDLDVLDEFEPEYVPSPFGIARLERELSALFDGRKVDLRTSEDLSRYFRQSVIEAAEVQYAQGRFHSPAANAKTSVRV
jgi:hypothetical protein